MKISVTLALNQTNAKWGLLLIREVLQKKDCFSPAKKKANSNIRQGEFPK